MNGFKIHLLRQIFKRGQVDRMFVSRFAPSPTGLLHLGHAYSALLTQNLVSKNSGLFQLRIEDIDTTRCKPDFENQIYADLEWLGIRWEHTPLRQSERLSVYRYNLEKLADKGLLYGCDCTRADIKKALSAHVDLRNSSNSAIYHGKCRERNLPLSGNNIRLNLVKSKHYLNKDSLEFLEKGSGPNGETGTQTFSVTWLQKNYGDFVLARRDIKTSYHLSVIVDDASQKVTHISRGNDLFYVTPIHILLQSLLKLRIPTYVHHDLVKDNRGNKLAKSKGAESLLNLRKSGKNPKEIRKMLGL